MSESQSAGCFHSTHEPVPVHRRTLRSGGVILLTCLFAPTAYAQMERANATAMASQSRVAAAAAAPANPNMNCTLIVPAQPLTARGLSTPYQLVGTNAAADGPCNESNPNQSAFVQAAIIDTSTGQVSIYNPLVIDQGTTPAVAPVVPKLPQNSVVALWFGFNGNTLTLQGAYANTLANAKCVNGAQNSPFTQVSYCNAPNFFQAADTAITNGQLKVPPLGTAKDGQTCPTLRSFFVVDQDQSDNLTTEYLLAANGRIAQNTAANIASLKGATPLLNPGDNTLFSAFIEPAIGCAPLMANDLANPGQQTTGLPLNELQARVLQAAPVGLTPGTDPMVLIDNQLSLTKDNLYRNGMGQPSALDAYADDGARYCREMLRIAPGRLFNATTENLLTHFASLAPGVANNLFSFLTQRFVASYMLLNCETLTGFANPVTAITNADGIFTSATLNSAAYNQILQHLQTLQTQDFTEDSPTNAQSASVGGNANPMCGSGNTLPGAAANYGVFIPGTGNFIAANSQMTGSLAVGGNITLANYAVASQVTGVPTAALNPADIVVGGTLTASNGNLGRGQGTIYFENGAPNLASFTSSGTPVSSTPFDFAAAQSYYQSAATALGALTPNGTTQTCNGCINFIGTSNTLNIFTVAGASLGGANTINIKAPSGSAVVINVTGTTAKFQNGTVAESGVNAADVLWNFPAATTLSLTGGMDPMGTILAPFSTVTGGFGTLTGQLVAATYSGTTTFTDVQYACTLPVP